MAFFDRNRAAHRDFGGQFARPANAAPPAHLRDKNKSHSGQGANASIPEQEADLGSEQPGDQPFDANDTTNQ